MYNKLFTKIVDSSIWMEPDHVRLVWLMFIALMDEDGFVNLASAKNVAHRAVMELDKAVEAIRILESPDPESSNPTNEGRRLTRVPGGWIVNNAQEYRDIVKREHQKELSRERVRRHRNGGVTQCNVGVTVGNENVTPSEAEAEADKRKNGGGELPKRKRKAATAEIVIPPKANTEAVHAAIERWRRHLDSIAMSHSLHLDNSPQLQAMFQQAAHLGEAKFVESIDWNIANGRHQFSEKWDKPYGGRAGGGNADATTDAVWMHVSQVLSSTDDTPSGMAERVRLLSPEQREAVKRCRAATRLSLAKSELDRRQIAQEFTETMRAVVFERTSAEVEKQAKEFF